MEEYIQEIFRDAKNWAEGCGRRRVGVRDLVEVLEGQGEEMMSELRRGEGSRAIYVDREERKTIPSSPGDKSTKEIDEEIRGSEGDMQGAEIEDDQGIITETQRAVVVPARGYVGLSISGELKRIRKMTRTWTRRRDQERITCECWRGILFFVVCGIQSLSIQSARHPRHPPIPSDRPVFSSPHFIDYPFLLHPTNPIYHLLPSFFFSLS